MVHRFKKCIEISEVTSGGGAEIENVKNDMPSDLPFHLRQQMLLLKSHCTFYIYGALGKKAFCWILKRWFISRITGQNIQKLQILLFFASSIASILKWLSQLVSECDQVVYDILEWFYNQNKWGIVITILISPGTFL